MSYEGWNTYKLEDLLEELIDYRGKTPKKTTSGIPLITAKIVKNGTILETNEFIAEEDYDTWMVRGLPKAGDVVLTTEAPLGEVAQLKNDRVALAQRIVTLRGKAGILDNSYLKYFFMSSIGQSRLKERETGTTVKGIKQSELRLIKINCPNINEQKKIATILYTMDQKIELNNRMNKVLEQMAQAIFKQWFVDFEFPNENGKPYKSSGGEMVWSEEIGKEIPKGWKVGTVKDLGEVVGGGTPSSKVEEYYTSNGIPWLTPKDLSNNKNLFIFRGARDITKEGLQNSSAKLMPKGTVLFSSRAPIGYIAIAANEVSTNQGFKSIIPRTEIGTEYIYCFLKENLSAIENLATGSTFKEVSGNILKNFTAIIPNYKALKMFSHIVSELNKKIKNNEIQISYLSSLRDTLLPKLISGEIDVSKIEVDL